MLATGKARERRAVRVRITGVVQGVGFRPFVYRLAIENGISGWVLNGEDGVHVVAEAASEAIGRFVEALRTQAPPAANVATFEVADVEVAGFEAFEIHESTGGEKPTVRISPDLAVCDDCLRELFDPDDRRFGYPYINCTNCGPRYSIVLGLPYDRPRTVMHEWPLCAPCRREYEDPADRRFHAQPVACPACGPSVFLEHDGRRRRRRCRDRANGQTACGRRDRRNQRHRRVSPRVRRARCGRGRRAARTKISQGASVRGDGPRSRHGANAGRSRPGIGSA